MPRGKFKTPCLICGVLSEIGNRCPKHQAELDLKMKERLNALHNRSDKRQKYKGDYAQKAKAVKQYALENGLNCPLCGLPLANGGSIHADHIYPAMGSLSPLQAVHARCNLKKGNRPPPNG